MTESLVSIGLPVYNGEKYLEEALRANLRQTYPHFELLICDNNSADCTEDICRSFAASDERVTYYRNAQNIGAAANYNRLFRLARGEFFRWTNADDLIEPTLLERTLPVLQADPDVVIAFGRTRLIDGSGGDLGEYDDNLELRADRAAERYMAFTKRIGMNNIIYGLMRSSAMARTSLMGDGKVRAGDINFVGEMALQGKFVEIPEVLFYRRIHQTAFSANLDRAHERAFWRASTAAVRFPHWRTRAAEIRAIRRAPLPASERLRLLAFSAKRLFWHRRHLLGDLLEALPLRRGR